MSGFEALLSAMQDPDKAALSDLASKYPDLKGGILRQDDYSRKMNELQEVRKNAEQADMAAAQWETWRKANWLDDQGMTKAESEARQELERLKSEFEGKGTDMTAEQLQQELNKAISAQGLMTQTQFQESVGAIKKEYEGTLTNLANLNTATTRLALQHFKDYGDILDTEAMYRSAQEKGLSTAEAAYQDYTSALRSKIQTEAQQKAIEEAYNKGKAEAAMQVGMGVGGQMPGDSEGPVLGPLQQQLLNRASGESAVGIPADLTLDSPALSAAMARHYFAKKQGS